MSVKNNLVEWDETTNTWKNIAKIPNIWACYVYATDVNLENLHFLNNRIPKWIIGCFNKSDANKLTKLLRNCWNLKYIKLSIALPKFIENNKYLIIYTPYNNLDVEIQDRISRMIY